MDDYYIIFYLFTVLNIFLELSPDSSTQHTVDLHDTKKILEGLVFALSAQQRGKIICTDSIYSILSAKTSDF